MYQMLRHPAAPGALIFVIYQEMHMRYSSNDLRVQMLHPTTAYYAIRFDECRAWTVLVQT